MALDPQHLPKVARAVIAEGQPLPLTRGRACNQVLAASLDRSHAPTLFPGARAPEAAISGLLLLGGCWDESHKISQDIGTQEGSYWHAIAHRIEPDSANAGWWFGQVGAHPIYAKLYITAGEILKRHSVPWTLKSKWDPLLFIEWCDQARRAPSRKFEQTALEIQRAEWELLFE